MITKAYKSDKLCGGHITKVYFDKGYSAEHIIISTDMEGFFGQFEVSLDDLVDYFNDHQEKEQCKCCKEFFFHQQIEANSGLCSCNWLEKCDTNHCDPSSPHREDHAKFLQACRKNRDIFKDSKTMKYKICEESK